MSARGRHRRRISLAEVAITLVTVAVILVVSWITGIGQPGRRAGTTAAQDTAARSARTQAAVATATGTCRTARQLVNEDLVATSGAIQQWRIHVDAMSQLVAGKITLQQASAFWASTRVEGARSLAFWDQVDQHYRTAGTSCTVPSAAGQNARLLTCQRRQQGADTLLARARTTLTDWRMHIGAMEALRAGKLDPGTAVRMWQQMWPRGAKTLKAYDAAYSQYDALPPCPLD